jgi:atypical dual specificity phosphatase
MKQVAPGVYIGDIEDAGSGERLVDAGITAVVKLTHAAPDAGYPETVTVADHQMVDGPQNDLDAFAGAVQTATGLLEQGETVLVHCKRGTSRSGAVVAAVVAQREEVDISTALGTVRHRKPDVDPHRALLRHAKLAVSHG